MACHWQVLQSHSGQLLTNQLVDELNRVEAAYESRTQGSLGRDIPTSEGGSDDIEAQANIYFHQMFSGQINIDVMIQMLTRFKESPDKRCISEINLKMTCYCLFNSTCGLYSHIETLQKTVCTRNL